MLLCKCGQCSYSSKIPVSMKLRKCRLLCVILLIPIITPTFCTMTNAQSRRDNREVGVLSSGNSNPVERFGVFKFALIWLHLPR